MKQIPNSVIETKTKTIEDIYHHGMTNSKASILKASQSLREDEEIVDFRQPLCGEKFIQSGTATFTPATADMNWPVGPRFIVGRCAPPVRIVLKRVSEFKKGDYILVEAGHFYRYTTGTDLPSIYRTLSSLTITAYQDGEVYEQE